MSTNCLNSKLPRIRQVKSAIEFLETIAYSHIFAGTFPTQIPLGPRLVVWVESDIQKWIADQVSVARG